MEKLKGLPLTSDTLGNLRVHLAGARRKTRGANSNGNENYGRVFAGHAKRNLFSKEQIIGVLKEGGAGATIALLNSPVGTRCKPSLGGCIRRS